jgi:chemotaxis protein methyltransferase CheR
MNTLHAPSARDMAALSALVYSRSGIRLTDAKRALVTARLQKRLRAGGFESFGAYIAHVTQQPDGAECRAMIDALTTNKTSFFRESAHYHFLVTHVVPELLASGVMSFAGWSAGCATGEEPYSLAMTLLDATRRFPSCSFEILATDLSATALSMAAGAVYPLERVASLPPEILRRHFERGIGADEGRARVQATVRRRVRFEQANLLEPKRLLRERHFIWCRNTLMYFDQPARQRAVSLLEASLAPGGYFFMSHAENLSGLRHALVPVAPAVYRRPA